MRRPVSFFATAFALAAAQAALFCASAQAAVANPAGLAFPSGTYRCELNRSVQVRQVAPDMQSAVLNWQKKDYTLHAVSTKTGALRYEDPKSGLVWLVIVGKSMLLDTKNGRQLANECKV